MNSLQERINIAKYAITISNILVLKILKPDKRISFIFKLRIIMLIITLKLP
ncbi:hypothetical protein DICPUDRAFT_148919 [Dictyostelium purpureum]|uniref:Uncharacterized protein n=1 Tax=Dictyostelium purpureum TaxID=5786 RepID=F0ZCC1_DICPU|nr:uncharacterized protein DICPUDRAFT_148919 [Dictyostelium purpureum]EGC38395.1 hypothetical protein DICPUDRAFT_148919 [Dictyostelium purpureum]|eukprot:XP_003285056.1 hypothetical protein DICPUDRAFT_148919 [Dictyostelium purpureum]